jgi:peptide/nickel transport system substrate-binding protein
MRAIWVLISLLMIATMVLSACGPAAGPAAGPTAVPTKAPAQPTAVPKVEPKVLSLGMHREFGSLDPAVYEGEPEGMAIGAVFDRLVCIGFDGEYHPWLATKWEISPDGKVWTFHLRDDVLFHDGTPFNAEAVKFHLDRAVDPQTKSQRAADLLAKYASSEVVDPNTIKITLKQAYAPFLDVLSQPNLGIPSPTGVKQWGNNFDDHLVGSGPFKFVGWKRQNYLVLEKNPSYKWGPACIQNQGAAYLDKLMFKFIPEVETREALLDRGEEVQVVYFPSPAGLARWKADPDHFTVISVVDPGAPWMNTINTQKPPTDELAGRLSTTQWIARPS